MRAARVATTVPPAAHGASPVSSCAGRRPATSAGGDLRREAELQVGRRRRGARRPLLRLLRIALADALDVARQLATLLDHQLAVADRPGDATRAVDDQARARRELAREHAVDLGDVDQRGALER